jgi:hypothetical protein
MSTLTSNAARKTPSLTFEPTTRRIKISLHQLINDLLTTLQPLARKRNNVVHNRVPQGLCFMAEENLLAYILWTLISSVINTNNNEAFQVNTLVDDDHTTICINDAGTYLYRTLAPEFRRLQFAALQCGGSINLSGGATGSSNLAFSISNRRIAQ